MKLFGKYIFAVVSILVVFVLVKNIAFAETEITIVGQNGSANVNDTVGNSTHFQTGESTTINTGSTNSGNTVTVHNGSTSENNVSTPSATPTPTITPSDTCIPTDLKGYFEYTGNHLTTSPVIGHFENISQNSDCPSTVTIHAFGSMQTDIEKDGWLESQVHVASINYTIPAGTTKTIEFPLSNDTYCWYQVEATRTEEVRTPPTYYGNDMIDYVFVKGKDCDVTPTTTPSLAPSGGNEEHHEEHHEDTHEESKPAEEKVLGATTMASTGNTLPQLFAGLTLLGTTLMGVTTFKGRK